MISKKYIVEDNTKSAKTEDDWFLPYKLIDSYTPSFVKLQLSESRLEYDTRDFNSFIGGKAKFNVSKLSLEVQLYFKWRRFIIDDNQKNKTMLMNTIAIINTTKYKTHLIDVDEFVTSIINEFKLDGGLL